MRFSLKNKSKLVKPSIWEHLPTPKANELFAAPVDNRLWHPTLAVRPSRSQTPEWFKDLPFGDMSLKRCYGVADLIRTGYVLPIWATLDVRRPISKLDQRIDARFNTIKSKLFEVNELSEEDVNFYFKYEAVLRNQFSNEQTGKECPVAKTKPRNSSYLKLVNPWVLRTAPGWSSLILPMLWEPSGNYQVLAAVVHTDYYPNANIVINILTDSPFTIEEGTSLANIVPFKRDDVILNTNVIRGDTSAHTLMRDTGFGSVFTTDADLHGGYKREQKRMDSEVKNV